MAKILVLTGTPGTGKNTVAEALQKIGYSWIALSKIVERERLWTKIEEGAKVVNMQALDKRVNAIVSEARREGKSIVIEGHLACEIKYPADVCIVLRTPPRILRSRLTKRKYPKYKIQRNIECELLGHCTQLAEKNLRCPTYEIRSDERHTAVMKKIKGILSGKGEKFKAGWVNWTKELLV